MQPHLVTQRAHGVRSDLGMSLNFRQPQLLSLEPTLIFSRAQESCPEWGPSLV